MPKPTKKSKSWIYGQSPNPQNWQETVDVLRSLPKRKPRLKEKEKS